MTERPTNPKVSVIIPFYKGVDWLCEAVDSVIGQDGGEYEIIVVNDGSPEDVSGFTAKYGDHVRYFEKENGGAASARNLGVQQARGEYLAFLDADDLWLPHKLSFQTLKMQEHGAVWSYTDYETFGDGITPQRKQMYSVPAERTHKGFSPYIGTPTVMVRRDHFTENKIGFPENMRFGQDVVCWEQLAAQSDGLYLPEVTARVRMRGTNAGVRAAVQLHARADIFDNCSRLIPTYRSGCTPQKRAAAGMCRFFRRFVKRDSTGKLNELWARALFFVPYLLYKADARQTDKQ